MVGCVVNGVPAKDKSAAAQLGQALDRRGLRLIAAVPYRPELTWLRVLDLVRELDPRVLDEGDLSRRIKEVAVLAQGVPGGLRMLSEGRLVVVPGDRHDVVMAACLAELNGTQLAALLLSAGIEPDPQVWELTRATCATGLPILVVDDDSYETATRVRDLDPGLPVDDLERIEAVTDDQRVDLPGALVSVARFGVGPEPAHLVLGPDAIAAEQLAGIADGLAHPHGAERPGTAKW